MAITKVYLTQYSASVDDSPVLLLGTKDSYGNEQLQIIRSPEWEDLIITATFSAGDTPLASPVLVPEDGLIDVPAGATAERLPLEECGVITFCGVADGVQRISTSLPYLVSDHGPVEGTVPAPTPSEWEQFVAQVKSDADWAKKGAADAEDAASDAKKALESTGAAVEDAKNAAAAAAQSAKEAAAESGKVQEAAKSSVSDIDAAKKAALTDIDSAKNSAVSEVNDAGAAQTKVVASAGSAVLASIGNAQQTTVQAVQQTGTAEAEKVNSAGAAQTKAVQDEGAEQVQAVTEAGDTQAQRLTALVPEVYTKAESDGRYAPIGAAIKVSGKGTGLVSLSPTVSWGMQELKLYGRSWQDSTPSTENPVPIQNAGQDGQIDVTVCTPNLYNTDTLIDGYQWDTNGALTINQQRCSTTKIQNPQCPIYIWLAQNYSIILVQFSDSGDLISRSFPLKNTKIVFDDQCAEFGVTIYVTSGAVDFDALKTGLVIGPALVDQYYPYKTPQQLPVPTLGGLPGIPVTSGGNWVDENGQQRVSNVIDVGMGAKTQYCGQIASYNGEEITTPYISSTGALTTGAQVVYVLPAPVTTPLDAATIAAYKALTTYQGTTNVLAQDCGIEASAVGDATQIIANITQKVAALESAATGI